MEDSSVVTDDVRGLVSLMQPPADGGDSCDWEGIAAVTGWRFPADYRELIETFGAGEIVGGASFGAPPRVGEPLDSGLLRGVPSRASAPALLSWGGTDVGESYYWQCADTDPDRWTVAVKVRRGNLVDLPMGTVEFLVRLLTGRTNADLDLDLAGTGHRFIGWREAHARLTADLALDEFDD